MIYLLLNFEIAESTKSDIIINIEEKVLINASTISFLLQTLYS